MVLKLSNLLLSEIDPDKIILYKLGPLNIIVVVWDGIFSNFYKRTLIRRLLKNYPEPFDIFVYTTKQFDEKVHKKSSMAYEANLHGKVIYEKSCDKYDEEKANTLSIRPI